jgi:hypothetical protein
MGKELLRLRGVTTMKEQFPAADRAGAERFYTVQSVMQVARPMALACHLQHAAEE